MRQCLAALMLTYTPTHQHPHTPSHTYTHIHRRRGGLDEERAEVDSEGTQADHGQRPRCVPLSTMAARTIPNMYRFCKGEDMLVEL